MKLLSIAAMMVACLAQVSHAAEWELLPALPDKEGFAGAFTGVSGGALLVAGGANFPGKKPWEGGTKVWHDTVFALDKSAKQWRDVGKLPRPLGYGVSVTYRDRVICVGGSDAERHYADAFQITWRDGKLQTTALPALPHPVANACGTLVGDTLYVAGGLESSTARQTLKTLYMLQLSAAEPQWKECDAWPGCGRMLSTAASFDGAFWLIGGCDLEVGQDDQVSRRYLRDGYRYDPHSGWKQVADLPYAVVAAASPAPHDAKGLYVLGGDDGAQVSADPREHRGFRKTVLRYDTNEDKWHEHAEMPLGVVTLGCVRWQASWVLPSGEVRPGVRTPQVMRWQTTNLE